MGKISSKRGATTPKGHRKGDDVLARKAMQHHDFIGQAEPERAEAEFRKHERVAQAQEHDAVKEMAAELNALAEAPSFSPPRSLREGIDMVKDLRERAPDLVKEMREKAPEKLAEMREMAEERLKAMPEPLHRAFDAAGKVGTFLTAPVRASVRIVGNILRTPAALFRIFREQRA